MRSRLRERLRCPVSGSPLLAVAIESGPALGGEEAIRTGILWEPGGHWYPIVNHVPIMLVFATRLTDDFAQKHAARIAELEGRPTRPNLAAETGERSVQETFTEEWAGLGNDELSFVYTQDELVTLHRDVWLRLNDSERAAVRSVLDVGIGFGKEALALARIFPSASITGVDLNLACVAAGRRLVETSEVDPVVASLFRLPFSGDAFEHVHCQGVLHHTRSTKDGFSSIARQVAPGGTLFVWVYAHEDRHVLRGLHGLLTRTYYWWSHRVFRPVLSRAPAVVRNAVVHAISTLMHPVYKAAGRHGEAWRYANTVHSVRDMFTPRYAFEHGFNEVLEWFEDAGYEPRVHSPGTYRRLFAGKRLYGVGAVGRRRTGTP